MKVFILAHSQKEVLETLYPALEYVGARAVGYATSLENLGETLAACQPDLVLVDMQLSRRGEEQLLLERIRFDRLAVLLPRGRQAQGDTLRDLPSVVAVGTECSDLLQSVPKTDSAALTTDDEPASAPTSERRSQPQHESPVRTVPPLQERGRKVRVIAFTSGLCGGTGKSTLAGTLAWLLAREGATQIVLLSFGAPPAALTHFKLERWPNVASFLAGEETFERTLQWQDGLAVSLAPGDLVTYDRIGELALKDSGAVVNAVNEAARRFDLVIADLPPDASGWAIQPLLVTDDVVVVARATVAGQAAAVQTLSLVRELRHNKDLPAHLVINGLHRADLSPGAFIAGLRQFVDCPEPAAVVPYNGAVPLAQNEGVPLPLTEGTDDVVTAVCRLADHLGFELRAEDQEDVDEKWLRMTRGKTRKISLSGVRFRLTD